MRLIWRKLQDNLHIVLITILALFAAFVLGAIIIGCAGFDPFASFAAIFDGAFGSKKAIAQTLTKFTPLLLIGVGVAIAFKGSSFNIGAEGQFLAGALGAAICELVLRPLGLPSFLFIPIILLVAVLLGGAYGFIPGYLKAKRGAAEAVTSVMLTSVMQLLMAFLIMGPIQEPKGFYPETDQISEAATLPYIWSKTRLHGGIVIALVVVVVLYIVLEQTTYGFKIKAVGQNGFAAEYAGISKNYITISTMVLSGAVAGLAGGIELLGTAGKLSAGISPGYGYVAIAVALLGRLNPLAIIFSALLFGALNTGANQMARITGAPSALASLLQALVLFFVVGGAFLEPWLKKKIQKKRTQAREAQKV